MMLLDVLDEAGNSVGVEVFSWLEALALASIENIANEACSTEQDNIEALLPADGAFLLGFGEHINIYLYKNINYNLRNIKVL